MMASSEPLNAITGNFDCLTAAPADIWKERHHFFNWKRAKSTSLQWQP